MPISVRTLVTSTIILLGVGFVALLGIVGTTIWLGERAKAYFELVAEARTLRAAAIELRSAMQGAESSQRGFILTGNEIYLSPYDAAKVQAERQLEILKRALTSRPEAEALLPRLVTVLAEKNDEMDQTIALRSDRRDAEALAILRTNRGKAL